MSASQGIAFDLSKHFATYQQNASAYASIVRQIPMQIKSSADLGKKNVSGKMGKISFVSTSELLRLPDFLLKFFTKIPLTEIVAAQGVISKT